MASHYISKRVLSIETIATPWLRIGQHIRMRCYLLSKHTVVISNDLLTHATIGNQKRFSTPSHTHTHTHTPEEVGLPLTHSQRENLGSKTGLIDSFLWKRT